MTRFDAVVFDLDGTLLDTLRDIAEACNRALEEAGYSRHPVDAYRVLVGDGARVLLERALPRDARAEQNVSACLQRYLAEYSRAWNVHTSAYDGIPALLDELVKRGMKLAVLSNKPHAFTVQCVETFLPRWEFQAVRGQSDAFPRKPDPASALDLARQMAVAPARTLYVGDTATDMHTATGAGMFAVGALWGFRDRAELQASGARAIIAHPRELLDILDADAPATAAAGRNRVN